MNLVLLIEHVPLSTKRLVIKGFLSVKCCCAIQCLTGTLFLSISMMTLFLPLKVLKDVTWHYSCNIEWYINIHITLFKNADIILVGQGEQTCFNSITL